jgi:hypothetical protein
MTRPSWNRPPAIIVRFELESEVKVYSDACSPAERERVADWLDQRSEYLDLVRRAIELAESASAA